MGAQIIALPQREAPAPDFGGFTLEQLQRAHIEAEYEPLRFAPSVLISMLATATPTERGQIIRELAGER